MDGKKCIGKLGNYLTRSNQPREEHGGEGSKVLTGKSRRRHYHLYLPFKRTISTQTEVFCVFIFFKKIPNLFLSIFFLVKRFYLLIDNGG
jgi:hypothetical protein